MLQGLKKFAVLGIVAFTFLLPATAMAQSPHNDQYDDSSVTFLGGSEDPADPVDPGASSNSSNSSWVEETLPFSGLDVVLLAAMGAGLVALGFGMRALTRRADLT